MLKFIIILSVVKKPSSSQGNNSKPSNSEEDKITIKLDHREITESLMEEMFSKFPSSLTVNRDAKLQSFESVNSETKVVQNEDDIIIINTNIGSKIRPYFKANS